MTATTETTTFAAAVANLKRCQVGAAAAVGRTRGHLERMVRQTADVRVLADTVAEVARYEAQETVYARVLMATETAGKLTAARETVAAVLIEASSPTGPVAAAAHHGTREAARVSWRIAGG